MRERISRRSIRLCRPRQRRGGKDVRRRSTLRMDPKVPRVEVTPSCLTALLLDYAIQRCNAARRGRCSVDHCCTVLPRYNEMHDEIEIARRPLTPRLATSDPPTLTLRLLDLRRLYRRRAYPPLPSAPPASDPPSSRPLPSHFSKRHSATPRGPKAGMRGIYRCCGSSGNPRPPPSLGVDSVLRGSPSCGYGASAARRTSARRRCASDRGEVWSARVSRRKPLSSRSGYASWVWSAVPPASASDCGGRMASRSGVDAGRRSRVPIEKYRGSDGRPAAPGETSAGGAVKSRRAANFSPCSSKGVAYAALLSSSLTPAPSSGLACCTDLGMRRSGLTRLVAWSKRISCRTRCWSWNVIMASRLPGSCAVDDTMPRVPPGGPRQREWGVM